MNILLTNTVRCAIYFILRSWERALVALGHKVAWFDNNTTIDFLESFKPDIYVGVSGHFHALPETIREKYKTKVVYHVNPYGKRIESEPGWPDINESDETIDKVAKQKPDLVWGYFCNDHVVYWHKWRSELGIPVCGIPTAGDHILYTKRNPEDRFKCDLAFVGGYWDYKGINLKKYLIPLCDRFNIKIYGSGWHKQNIIAGEISDEDVPILFSSAKIGPCVHEPHTTVYGIDIPERIFKVPLCGLLAVTDPVMNIEYYFPPGTIPVAINPEHYVSLVEYYLRDKNRRKALARIQKNHILSNHTYIHRMMTLFNALGMIEECQRVREYMNGELERVLISS